MSLIQDMAKLFTPDEGDPAAAVQNAPQVPVATLAEYPPVNLWENDDFVYAEALMPGLKLADLDISISVVGDQSRLMIKGEQRKAKPANAHWHTRERGFGTFERTINLPVPMETSEADAVLDDGILTLKMAKSPQAKAKRIPVTSQPTQD